MRGDFPGNIGKTDTRDNGCNLQMLSDLPDVTQELCDGAQIQSTPNLPRRGISVVLLRHPFSSSGPGLLSLFYHFQLLFSSFLNAWLCNLSNVEVLISFFFVCVRDIYKLTVLKPCRNDCV